MGRETALPEVRVGEDVLVAGGLAAANDPEARDERAVGERPEIRSVVAVGDGALRFGLPPSEGGVPVPVLVSGPLVLGDGERDVLLPVVAGKAPNGEAVRS